MEAGYVLCKKKQELLPALQHSPLQGELGRLILDNVSKAVWDEWLNQQTILINEMRLNLWLGSARVTLTKACLEFCGLAEHVDKFALE